MSRIFALLFQSKHTLYPTTIPSDTVKQQVLLFNNLQVSPSQPSNAWLHSRASKMFLRPAQLQRGEKAIRISDLWDNKVLKDHDMVDRVMSPNSPRTKRFFPTSTAAAAHLPAFSIPETSVYIVLTTDRAGLILMV